MAYYGLLTNCYLGCSKQTLVDSILILFNAEVLDCICGWNRSNLPVIKQSLPGTCPT